MGMAEGQANTDPAGDHSRLRPEQDPAAGDQGLLQRCVLVSLRLSSALLTGAKHTPAVGPIVASVEDALLPYASSAGEHLKQHGQPILAFGDKQLKNAYTLVTAAFPVTSPLLDTASSVSDCALSVLSEAATSVRSKGFLATGVDYYDQCKAAAVQKGDAALQYLEGSPVLSVLAPLIRCAGRKVTGILDWAVDSRRPKRDFERYSVPAEPTTAAVLLEVASAEGTLPVKGEVSFELPETTDKNVAIVPDVKIAAPDAAEKVSEAPPVDEVVPVLESLFEAWETGTRSRKSSVVAPKLVK